MRLYLVDDDAEDAELFTEAVNSIDSTIEVHWFDNVRVALDSLLNENTKPDAIFLDLNIPRVSGKELLKMLRDNATTETIPVVIYSTSISPKDIDDTTPFQVASYLQKPESFSVLCTRLSEVLKMLG